MTYYETGPVPHHSGATIPFTVDVVDVGLLAPTVSTSRAYDITNPASVSDVSGTVLSGSATINVTRWTTPLLTSLTAGQTYRVETDITDGSNTHTFVLFVKCPY